MPDSRSNPAEWLDRYGDFLYRYAMVRLHDRSTAEDMVQETLLAGLKAHDRFAGRSSEQTWLVGILKHKIIDHLRRSSREKTDPVEEATIERAAADCFDARGHWRVEIGDWANPDRAFEQDQFWETLTECIERLPPRLHRLFVLRQVEGLGSEEICDIMNISTTNNLWVMLSRMRLRLRNCLDAGWFGQSPKAR